MFKVRDFMTRDVVCCEPDDKITKVVDLMKKDHIHRIPVVNADHQLVGLITEGMITGSTSATSLSIYELNYLLSKTEVRTIMVKKVHRISEDALMEQATELMLKADIGCLPVVNDKDQVVGILTQNDVFKSFLKVLGWKQEGARVSLEVKDKVGQLEKIAKIFADAGISIYNIGVYDKKGNDVSMIIRASAAPDELKGKLEEIGYERVQVLNN